MDYINSIHKFTKQSLVSTLPLYLKSIIKFIRLGWRICSYKERTILGVITGCCMIGCMSERMGYSKNVLFRQRRKSSSTSPTRMQFAISITSFRDLECLEDVPLNKSSEIW